LPTAADRLVGSAAGAAARPVLTVQNLSGVPGLRAQLPRRSDRERENLSGPKPPLLKRAWYRSTVLDHEPVFSANDESDATFVHDIRVLIVENAADRLPLSAAR